MKYNCYKCKHKGTVVGSAHSSCNYPGTSSRFMDFGSMKNIEIKGDPHGIKMGWFIWPINFDPVWLTNCNGFEQKI